MSGKSLLDTNIVIAFFDGDDQVLDKIADTQIYIPSPVVGELRFGAEKSKKKSSNQKQIDLLLSEVTILPVTETTATYYGKIKNLLKQKGKPIPENDIWIAAIAKEYDLFLVTRDAHFSNIEDLKLLVW